MQYVYDFVVLVIWTGICAALVYGVEHVLELFGYRAQPVGDARGDHGTSSLPED
jgi:hypothetical protein